MGRLQVTAARAERLQESVRILSQESGSQVSETMREVLTARSALEAAQAENERLVRRGASFPAMHPGTLTHSCDERVYCAQATEMASGATYTAELQATVDSLQHDLAMESVRTRSLHTRRCVRDHTDASMR